MTPQERDRLAEQWLEMALKQRGEAPRPGLEARILAAMDAEKRVARSPFPVARFAFRVSRFAWPVAAAAAVLILALGLTLHWNRRPAAPSAGDIASRVPSAARTGASADVALQALNTSALHAAQDGASGSAHPHPSLRSGWGTRPVANAHVAEARGGTRIRLHEPPRQEQFPATRPLSEQERLLVAYLRTTPREELLLVAQRQAADEMKRQEQLRSDFNTPASGEAAPDGTTEEK